MLLQAIAILYKEAPETIKNWHIDIVGWNHENCQTELEKIVTTHNLQNIVTFMAVCSMNIKHACMLPLTLAFSPLMEKDYR